MYQRVFTKSKDEIIRIYKDYFMNEGKNILNVIEKAPDFITDAINLNKKNTDIVSMLGGMLEFDRIRVESIEKILSCEMVEGGKYEGKYYLGAKHISGILHQKIRAKYSKEEKYGEEEVDMLNLFKILKYKTAAIKEYSKHLNNRLLEELDMSKDGLYSNAIALETKVIEEVRKESSENDVKNLQQCLRDITKSEEITSNLTKRT